jgi:hypothetical protein
LLVDPEVAGKQAPLALGQPPRRSAPDELLHISAVAADQARQAREILASVGAQLLKQMARIGRINLIDHRKTPRHVGRPLGQQSCRVVIGRGAKACIYSKTLKNF